MGIPAVREGAGRRGPLGSVHVHGPHFEMEEEITVVGPRSPGPGRGRVKVARASHSGRS